MKDKIQELIKWSEVREKAFSACNKVFLTDRAKFKSLGRLEENAFWKQQLTLLLSDKPTRAITEAAHSANTTLGERAANSADTHIGDGGADSSETAIVGQNEKAKEVCLAGKHNYQVLHYGKCRKCNGRDFRQTD